MTRAPTAAPPARPARAGRGFAARVRGGFVLGIVVGLLVGLALALGVALYITKAPVPFVNKVPQRTAEQDQAEADRNRTWDPNAPLAGRSAPPRAPAASAPPTAAVPPAPAASVPRAAAGRDPAAILAGRDGAASAALAKAAPAAPAASAPKPATARTGDPFQYFVQAGAYTRGDDAEAQRAKLAMLGHGAKVTEREQAGRTVYRVRIGPFETREQADGLQQRLLSDSIETQLVRVERP
jgi:cell division protein FtsN